MSLLDIISHATGQVRARIVEAPLNGGYVLELVPGEFDEWNERPHYVLGDEYLPDG